MHTRNNQIRALRQGGFSLIEILIVVALIALIAGMVANQVFGGRERANVKLAQSQVADLAAKVEQYEMDVGKLPERLEDLVTEPGNSAGWLGPYAKASALKDPWNTPIQYRAPGDGVPFEIVSLGNDRKAGGSGVDKDISSKD